MDQQPLILAAVSTTGREVLQASVGRDARIVIALSLREAIAELKKQPGFSLIVASIYFDESRMFALMRECRDKYPTIPFVCARMRKGDVSHVFVEGLKLANETLGCAYIDYLALLDGKDVQAALAAFRARLLREIRRNNKPA